MSSADQAYADLIHRVKEARLLESCGSVLGWDERTYMPREGSAHRAEQLALLARMTHEMLTDPKVGELLTEVESSPPKWALVRRSVNAQCLSPAQIIAIQVIPPGWRLRWAPIRGAFLDRTGPGGLTPPMIGAWRSLVAHLLWEQRVAGSNPAAPTIK